MNREAIPKIPKKSIPKISKKRTIKKSTSTLNNGNNLRNKN